MTTHVFIVDDNTFKYHLEYMFAGTGSKKLKMNFNNSSSTSIKSGTTEKTQVAMMADGCRVRKGDVIIFYLQAKKENEGRFYGIFEASQDGIFIDDSDSYLGKTQINKFLPYRLKIKPLHVYAKGITEWEALDEIRQIQSPCQMLWSLIYRKLKGNRGNTMITIYESERLFNLIRGKQTELQGDNFSFNEETREIFVLPEKKSYVGEKTKINILPRLIAKYTKKSAFETHLQLYIAQKIGIGENTSLDFIFDATRKNIEWIGNEVSCGVGMQRIDILISKIINNTERFLFPIELKDEIAKAVIVKQIERYIDWLEQYYIPNRPSTIQPVIISRKPKRQIANTLKENLLDLNKRRNIRPVKYVVFEIENNDLKFSEVDYTK